MSNDCKSCGDVWLHWFWCLFLQKCIYVTTCAQKKCLDWTHVCGSAAAATAVPDGTYGPIPAVSAVAVVVSSQDLASSCPADLDVGRLGERAFEKFYGVARTGIPRVIFDSMVPPSPPVSAIPAIGQYSTRYVASDNVTRLVTRRHSRARRIPAL
ncbi:Hypothetical protein CINCED_3A003046 [Cinara cedri]|uniref:Uncharacterized protein n=1 Tax=Cinara cedri TaxID=506608 RepID=A0A5E4MCF3_9HEMI|nr:Hypothetical protein CINCED_3A003046 [Cinara cedri]